MGFRERVAEYYGTDPYDWRERDLPRGETELTLANPGWRRQKNAHPSHPIYECIFCGATYWDDPEDGVGMGYGCPRNCEQCGENLRKGWVSPVRVDPLEFVVVRSDEFYLWKTKDSGYMQLSDMEDDHLINCLRQLVEKWGRNSATGKYHIEKFEAELQSRGVDIASRI